MFLVTVTPDDGESYELKVTSRDLAKWEKAGPSRSLKRLEEQTAYSDIYAICYLAAKRTGNFTGSQKEFEDSVDLGALRPDEANPTSEGQ